jgi:uncharacterized protein (TIGR02996 family)
MSERALLDAILRDRDADGPRLIYADWLGERGDPRGELIRVQCTLAADVGLDPDTRCDLREREEDLLDAHGPVWRAAAGTSPTAKFRRGFPDLSIGGDLPTALLVAQRTVVEDLCLASSAVRPELLPVFDELLPLVGGLLLRSSLRLEELLVRLSLSSQGRSLRRMALFHALPGKPGVATLAATPWTQLERLRIAGGRLDDDDVTLLAGSPHHQGLRALDVSQARVGARGVLACAALPLLEELDLSGNALFADPAPLAGLAPSLRTLDVSGCPLGDTRFAATLEHAPWRDRLVELRAKGCDLGPATLRAAAGLPSLRVLELGESRVGRLALGDARSLEALSLGGVRINPNAATLPPTLRELEIGDEDLDDQGAIELIQAAPAALRILRLRGSRAGAKTVDHLKDAPQRLRSLSVAGVTSQSIRLAQAPAFAALRDLSIDAAISDDELRALDHPRISSLFLHRITEAQIDLLIASGQLPALRTLATPRWLIAEKGARLRARGITRLVELD